MSEQKKSKHIILFSMVIAAGLFFVLLGINYLLEFEEAAKWPVTEGRIISTEVKKERYRHKDHNKTRYRPVVIYEYKVNGTNYKSDHITLVGQTTRTRVDSEKILERYPVGKKILVHYDPNEPSRSILDPNNIKGPMTMIIVGGFFALIGVFGFFKVQAEHKRRLKS